MQTECTQLDSLGFKSAVERLQYEGSELHCGLPGTCCYFYVLYLYFLFHFKNSFLCFRVKCLQTVKRYLILLFFNSFIQQIILPYTAEMEEQFNNGKPYLHL